jgi:aspartate aminotransferase
MRHMSQRGLSRRLDALNESATLALNARAKQLAAEGRTIYNLTAGELAADTPEYIQEAVAGTLDKNKYTPVPGLPELRTAIAGHAKEFYDVDWIKPPNVVVTSGAKPALYGAFLALLDEGDEVIVPVPAWVSYMDLIELAGGKVVQVPLTEHYDLDVAAIKAAITGKTKAIIINSPQNPTGSVYSKESVHQLAQELAGSGIWVISDDIYTKLVFEDDFEPVPKAGFENLVIINGFSKSQALTGWRIGYLIAGKELAAAVTGLLSHITGNAPLPGQYAALKAMELDDKPPQETIKALKEQRELVASALDEIKGIKYHKPEGAFYFFLDLRGITGNSAEWCEQLLLKRGVALVPGEAFMAPGFARLTFVADRDILKKALAAIKDFVEAA